MGKNAKLNGRCLCGAVRFEATPLGHEMGVCHCGMCRRWSGGTFMAVECEGLQIVGEEPAIYRSSDWGERGFCHKCGSSLFWRGVGGDRAAVSIHAFEDPDAFAFVSEIFVDEKPANYGFANDTKKMTGAEVIAAFTAKQDAGNA